MVDFEKVSINLLYFDAWDVQFLKILDGGVMNGVANACYDDDGQKYFPAQLG